MNTHLHHDHVHDDYEVEVHEEVIKEDGPLGVDRRERVEVVRDHGLEQSERIVENRGVARTFAIFQVTNIVWFLVALLEILLLLRLGLRMIAANPDAPFVAIVYGVSSLFLWPFANMVANPTLTNGIVLEITTVFAMVVYLILGWIAVKLIQMVTTPTPVPSRQVRVERHERL